MWNSWKWSCFHSIVTIMPTYSPMLYLHRCIITPQIEVWSLKSNKYISHFYSSVISYHGPVSLTVFAHTSISMENSSCSNSVAGHQITTKIWACHESTIVEPCTKFCGDDCIGLEVRVKRNFDGIWIAMENISDTGSSTLILMLVQISSVCEKGPWHCLASANLFRSASFLIKRDNYRS